MFSMQFSIKDNHRDIIMVKNVTVVIFYEILFRMLFQAHLQSSVFKLSKDLIDSIHEEGIVAYTS